MRFLYAWLGLALICFLTSCFGPIGDRTRDVTVHNGLDVPITVYSFGRDPRYKLVLAPGETTAQAWMYPISPEDFRKRRVEADDQSGRLLFCVDVNYRDLVTWKWTLDVAGGHESCPQ